MRCRHCDVATVDFAVPADLRVAVPDEAAAAAFCPHCLRVFSLERSADEFDSAPTFDAVDAAVPDGESGVVVALLLGLLDSLTLERRTAEELVARAETAGVDVFLVLDRLADSDAEPHFDIDRRRTQLLQLLD